MSWIEQLEKLPILAAQYGFNVLMALAIFFIGKWVARRLVNFGEHVMIRRGFDKTRWRVVSNIVFLALLIMVIIAALGQLGIPTASFIASYWCCRLSHWTRFTGSLSNFASGVLLVTFRPCKVGDYIEAAGVSGTVDDITLFSTRLITPDQRTITVPNSNLFGGPMSTTPHPPARRLDLVICVSYDSDLEQVKGLLRKIVESDARVLEEKKPVQIGVLELAASSVNFAVRPWVSNADYMALHFDLHEKIKNEFDAAGINILIRNWTCE